MLGVQIKPAEPEVSSISVPHDKTSPANNYRVPHTTPLVRRLRSHAQADQPLPSPFASRCAGTQVRELTIRGLDKPVKENDVRAVFSKFGQVTSVGIVRNCATQVSSHTYR